MNLLGRTFRSETGVALPLALFGLVMLSGLLVTFLAMAGMEPAIATNLTSVTQARYVADAGVEFGFDQLAANLNWSGVLLGNDGQAGTSDDGELAAGTQLPGLGPEFGTFSVTVRNDNQPGDNQLTGLPMDPGNDTTDTNGILVLTGVGTAQGVTRQIQTVVSRIGIPQPSGGVSCAGARCDFDTGTIDDMEGAHFHSDGRDYNRDGSLGTGPLKYAIAVSPGVDPNTGLTLEEGIENALNSHQLNEMDGNDRANPGNPVLRWNDEGTNTVVTDTSVTPQSVADFLRKVKAQRGVDIIDVRNRNTAVVVNDGASTDPNISFNLGTVSNPTITYIKDSPSQGKTYSTLTLTGTNSGAGILIVEDGDVSIGGEFRWDGIIIVTGDNVGVSFGLDNRSFIYGGLLLNETNVNDVWTDDLFIAQNAHGSASTDQFTTLYWSQENFTMVQNMPGLVRTSSWREF